jgi:dsRNA-specific ribonuclease
LFEAFIGAIFLDFNKINIHDDDKWFDTLFHTGPGFQMAQVFIERVFEDHVDWISLIQNDDNYKNILQVRIQKEFKTTPHYMEVEDQPSEVGYYMGVYLCLGQPIFGKLPKDAMSISNFANFQEIHQYMSIHHRAFIFLGEGKHKIKKKAEQIACDSAIRSIANY